MPLQVLITGNAEAAKLSKNTSKAVMVLTIVERPTAKTAYLSGKINTIQLPDVSGVRPRGIKGFIPLVVTFDLSYRLAR